MAECVCVCVCVTERDGKDLQDARCKLKDRGPGKKILRDVSRTGAVVRISLPSPWGRGNENRPSGYPGQVGAQKN